MSSCLLPLLLIASLALSSQESFLTRDDSVYTRNNIAFLTSRKCFGRGYTRNGLRNAEKFLVKEMKRNGLSPFVRGSFVQPFTHPVNTFPARCRLKINGVSLTPGTDFIPAANSRKLRGKFILRQKDSVTYVNDEVKLALLFKKKLTFSVSQAASEYTTIEIDQGRFAEQPREAEILLEQKLVRGFESRNIAGSIKGSSGTDSMIVFTAHYDHLGGIGRKVFFPGANDNASGVSLLLNLMRYYRAHPPRLNTLFIFFAAEEAGLIGSKYFVSSDLADLSKIRFLINLDLLGTGDDGIMAVNGAVHEKEFELLKKINQERNLVKEIRKRGKAANSDHYWFSENGVPGFFIYTMGGTTAYHDVFDVAENLPLTDYKDVFELIIRFAGEIQE